MLTAHSTLRRRASGLVGTAAFLGALASQGCLDRKVALITPEGGGVVVHEVTADVPDKVDLLIMIDNSSSMNDKQTELTRRVPTLIQLLTNPLPDATGTIPTAVTDIHVGVITSSLGSYGTDACPSDNPETNDHGHLLPRTTSEASGSGFSYNTANADQPLPQTCPTPVVASAVSWTFNTNAIVPGEYTGGPDGVVSLETATSCVVASVNEAGCGYEASLEAVYHFLMDPAPYLTAEVSNCVRNSTGGDTCNPDGIVVNGVDSVLLAERKAFLRPDSLLAVILLTDENDGSVNVHNSIDWNFTGLGGGTDQVSSGMPRGWKACESLPDDFESETYSDLTAQGCHSCGLEPGDPGGNCAVAWQAPGSTDWDDVNLRMFENSHRYGLNGLYSRQRYVDGFTKPQVTGSDGHVGANGIYAGNIRTPNDVVFATIVGVPEFLVADPTTHAALTLDEAHWAKIVSPDHTVRDPHMIESITPRPGIAAYNPAVTNTNALDVMPTGTTDMVNGGDRPMPTAHDLQYACLGFRSTAKPDADSDCGDGPDQSTVANNPVCGVDAMGNPTQPRYKAYPGLRELRVLHEISLANPSVGTVAASICAASFAPAVQSIVAKLQAVLDSLCLKSPLKQDSASESVNCIIEEVFEGDTYGGATPDMPGACEAIGAGYCTPGQAPCRLPVTDADTSETFVQVPVTYAALQATLPVSTFDAATSEMVASVTASRVSNNGNVFVDTIDATGATVSHLICEELQLTNNRLPAITQAVTDACVNDKTFTLPSGIAGGWCYSSVGDVISPSCQALGSTGTIRFLGIDHPHPHSQVFTICNE